MTVISLPLTRPAPGENDTPSAETVNHSAYNIIAHCALQRTESKLYRIGQRRPHELTLSLFVSGILADYSDASLSLDDLALLANWFYWRSHFHSNNLLSIKSIVYYNTIFQPMQEQIYFVVTFLLCYNCFTDSFHSFAPWAGTLTQSVSCIARTWALAVPIYPRNHP